MTLALRAGQFAGVTALPLAPGDTFSIILLPSQRVLICPSSMQGRLLA